MQVDLYIGRKTVIVVVLVMCIATAWLTAVLQGREPITGQFAGDVHSVDYIWFSSVSLDVLGVLKVIEPQLNETGLPSAIYHSDHMSIKAGFAFKQTD